MTDITAKNEYDIATAAAPMTIRRAVIEDLPVLTEIYNHEVEHGVANFDIHPKTVEEREEWFYQHNVDNHPLIVAEIDGEIVGYASLSPYRPKEAYVTTVELSVYVRVGYRRRGIATALMEAVISMAKEDERTHIIVSVITSENEASIRLHEKFGFTFCGAIHEAGMKFGRYLTICNYELKV